jgi:putative endonuclease
VQQSIDEPGRFYTGVADDVKARPAKHNAKAVSHTSKYAPWKLKTYVGFSDEKHTFAFEKYLKSASGRAFAKKRLYPPRQE